MIAAVVDADHEVLERWPEMAEAEMAVVCDARLGGWRSPSSASSHDRSPATA